MIADHRVARPIAVEPAREPDMELAPARLREEPVRRILEKGVAEPVPAGGCGLDELALGEPVELVVDRSPDQSLDGGHPEVPAGHRRDSDHLLLRLRQRLEPGRQQHLERSRKPRRRGLVADQRRQMLGEQRVALGRRDDPLGLPGLELRGLRG